MCPAVSCSSVSSCHTVCNQHSRLGQEETIDAFKWSFPIPCILLQTTTTTNNSNSDQLQVFIWQLFSQANNEHMALQMSAAFSAGLCCAAVPEREGHPISHERKREECFFFRFPSALSPNHYVRQIRSNILPDRNIYYAFFIPPFLQGIQDIHMHLLPHFTFSTNL